MWRLGCDGKAGLLWVQDPLLAPLSPRWVRRQWHCLRTPALWVVDFDAGALSKSQSTQLFGFGKDREKLYITGSTRGVTPDVVKVDVGVPEMLLPQFREGSLPGSRSYATLRQHSARTIRLKKVPARNDVWAAFYTTRAVGVR